MKRGDTVTIYEDPITREKPEGQAVLLKRIDSADSDMERWRVQFKGDLEMVVERDILHISLKRTPPTTEVEMKRKNRFRKAGELKGKQAAKALIHLYPKNYRKELQLYYEDRNRALAIEFDSVKIGRKEPSDEEWEAFLEGFRSGVSEIVTSQPFSFDDEA